MNSALFSERIRQLRQIRKWTQEDLAERVGVGRETISKWESGKHAASLKRLPVICEAFGITEEEFWQSGVPTLPTQNTARPMGAGPYLGVPTNESNMALECPRCGATDFSPKAVHCRGCAFPLYNLCTALEPSERHNNPSDAAFCEDCARPTFWSLEYVTLDEILGRSEVRTIHNAEAGRNTP